MEGWQLPLGKGVQPAQDVVPVYHGPAASLEQPLLSQTEKLAQKSDFTHLFSAGLNGYQYSWMQGAVYHYIHVKG